MNNIMDYIKIVLIAFIGIWIINRALDKFGASQFKA